MPCASLPATEGGNTSATGSLQRVRDRVEPPTGGASGADSRPRHVVLRPRLHALLEEGIRGRLTLVSAPPGSGKTVLLQTWLASRENLERVALVSLADVDPTAQAFWSVVAGSLVGATDARPPPDDASEAALVATLVAALEGDEPLLLVIDDFQAVAGEAVLRPLTRLLRHAPSQLRVVLATRRDPDLELHRLRLEGVLREIRARELAFTEEEAGELFVDAGCMLDGGQLSSLVERTEGWAAALRFAALSLAERTDVDVFVDAFERS